MTSPFVTPEKLVCNPELAALEILTSTTETARKALFAIHPELISFGDFLIEEPSITPQQCLAMAVLASLDSLIESVEHYCSHIDSLTAAYGARIGLGNDDSPF